MIIFSAVHQQQPGWMVMRRNANGLTKLKNKGGKTLKEFETNKKTSKV